jgi:hypothetical protein
VPQVVIVPDPTPQLSSPSPSPLAAPPLLSGDEDMRPRLPTEGGAARTRARRGQAGRARPSSRPRGGARVVARPRARSSSLGGGVRERRDADQEQPGRAGASRRHGHRHHPAHARARPKAAGKKRHDSPSTCMA